MDDGSDELNHPTDNTSWMKRSHPSQRLGWRLSLLLPLLVLVLWMPKSLLHPCLQTMLDNPTEQNFSREFGPILVLRNPRLKTLDDLLKSLGLPHNWLYHDLAEPPPFFVALKQLTEEKGGRIPRQAPPFHRLLIKDFPTPKEYDESLCIDIHYRLGRAMKASDGERIYLVLMLKRESQINRRLYRTWTLLLYDFQGNCLQGIEFYAKDDWWDVSDVIRIGQLPGNGRTYFEISIGQYERAGTYKTQDDTVKTIWKYVEKERHKIVIRNGRFVDLLAPQQK
jgi:hypothetical protein